MQVKKHTILQEFSMSTFIARSQNLAIAQAKPGAINGDSRLIRISPFVGVSMRFAALLPERLITNQDILGLLQVSEADLAGKIPSPDWPVKRTQAVTRHWCDPQVSVPQYIHRTCKRLFDICPVGIKDVSMALDCTVTSQRWPTNASFLADLFGQTSGLAGAEMTAACASTGYGLWGGINLVSSGFHQHVLVTGEDVMAEAADLTDLSTSFLFGDGFTATLISAVPPDESMLWYADLDQVPYLNPFITSRLVTEMLKSSDEEVRRGILRVAMDGKEVFNFVMRELPAYVAKALELTGLRPEDFAAIIPHAANGRMIETFFFEAYPKTESLMKRGLVFTRDQVINNFCRVGNTTAASLILGLMEFWCRVLKDPSARRLKAGDKIMLLAFGGGGVVSLIILEWPKGYPEPEEVPWAQNLADELFAQTA